MAKNKILVIDDENLVRWSLQQKLTREEYEVETAATGEDGLRILQNDYFDLVLLDIRMPGMDGVQVLREIKKLGRETAVIMLTAETGIARAVECMRLGAHNYLCKPFEFDEVRVALEKANEELKLRREVNRLHTAQSRAFGVDNIIGDGKAIRELRDLIGKIAASDATTVLVEGENGTGKELAARAVHFGSARAEQPLMEINCSALPENLLETELFGHERGAFTDAKTQKKGLFELADGGTVLLDEIGDMKLSMQVKLLRVLETRRFRRVGGTQDIVCDIRVVALTNKDLEQAVRTGEFRQDLYYRLKVIPVRMPSLRDHREDVPALAMHFLQRFSEEFKKPLKRLAPETAVILQTYHWPGNVRELRNVIERLVILEADETLLPKHLPLEIRGGGSFKPIERGVVQLPAGGIALRDVERELILQAMDRAAGNQTRAAELLGIERDALRRRLIKYGFLDASGEMVPQAPKTS